MDNLTPEEFGALRTLSNYGDGLDLTGRRVGTKVKNIVKGLLERGYMAGSLGDLRETDKGKTALAAEDNRVASR